MKIVGWVFLSFALLGGLYFISYVADWNFPRDSDIMGEGFKGGASNAPLMLGLFALAGAYLVSRSKKRDD